MPQPEALSNLSPAKKLLAGLLTLLVLGAGILALAEGAVRVRAWIKYGSADHFDEMYYYDEQLGLKYVVPNYRTRTVQVNSIGFRGPELEVKSESTLRIGFLGGSTTFCAEVSGNDQVWAALLSANLQSAFPGLDVDYVNGGVPGYTLEQSLKNLERRVAPLDPDVIVIYHASNDMTGETRELAKESGILREFHRDPSWLARHFLLWHLAEMNLKILLVKREGDEQKLKLFPDDFGAEFDQKLEHLIASAQKVAEIVVVVTWTQQIREQQSPAQQLEAASSGLYYMPFMTPTSLLEAYGRYNTAIRNAATRTGAILVEEENSIPGDGAHFNDTVHFKDAGSRAMADRIARRLLESPRLKALVQKKLLNSMEKKS